MRKSLLAFVVAACTAQPMLAAEDAASELEEVVQRLNALDTWIDDAGRRLANQQKSLSNADRGIAEIAVRTRALSTQVAQAEADLEGLAAQREQLQARRLAQAEYIAEHIRAGWRLSGRAFVKALLNQEDPAAYERMIRYHGYFANARADAIAEFRATLGALSESERELREQRDSLQVARQTLDNERATLLGERGKRRQLIAGLRTDLSDKGREREQLESSRERLAALIADLERQAALAAAEPVGEGLGTAGDLPWPVDGQVHRRFGEERASGRMRWQGMLIQASSGSDIRAVAAGQVVFADWLRGFGLLAIVDHGDDHMSLYGHADALHKHAGDRVEGGETIATIGQSGGQADVGLYFEIRQGGEPIDPRLWLQSRTGN